MGLSAAVAGLVAALVAMLATPLAIVLARRTGILDRPGPLKPHAEPTPYLGGLAVFVGLAVPVVSGPHRLILVPLAGALILGLLDDIVSLPAVPRLVTEAGVGLGVAWAVGSGSAAASAAIVVVTVVLINAVNLVDGIDALAAGVCAVTFLGFSAVLVPDWVPVAAAMAGGCAGFLVFNRPPARIYLGDSGSYVLGTAIAVVVAAYGAESDETGLARGLAITIALVGYPIVELVSTVSRRLVRRRPLFAGDRDHVYDWMVNRGRSARTTAALLIGGQAAVVALAVIADSLTAGGV